MHTQKHRNMSHQNAVAMQCSDGTVYRGKPPVYGTVRDKRGVEHIVKTEKGIPFTRMTEKKGEQRVL